MKNNKKMILKTKDEKRRLAFEKRNVKKDQNLARYSAEGGSALIMAKTADFNRRLIAAFMALVFVLTTLVVGVNVVSRAEETEDYNMFQENGIENSGLVLRKGWKYDEQFGTYSLKLESYSTKELAKTTFDNNNPMDIILVMDQSGAMGTNDVWTGGYEEVNRESFSIQDIQEASAQGREFYYKDENGNYWPVSYEQGTNNTYATIKDSNGSEITSWTAQSANQKYTELGNNPIFYKNGNSFEEVKVQKKDWYEQYTGSDAIRIYNISDGLGNAGIEYGHPTQIKSYTSWFQTYYYYGSVDDNHGAYVFKNGMWHQVYVVSKGALNLNYPTTLFYYTNSFQDTLVHNYDTWNDYKGNPDVITIIDSEDYYGWAIGDANTGPGKKTYTNGDLYFSQGQSPYYNYLYTDNVTLAEQEPNTQYSNKYEDVLYYKGYRLNYTDETGVKPIGNAVFSSSNEPAFITTNTEKLYVKQLTTDKAVAKEAATNFATTMANANSNNRIAVVGFNGSEVGSDYYVDGGTTNYGGALVTASGNDEDSSGLNDDIELALNNLLSSGDRNTTSGFDMASKVFAATNPALDDGSNRKRVVILFTDGAPTDVDTAKVKANELKDKYEAAVYTVGLKTTAGDDFMHKASSEWFYTKETNDGTFYFYGEDKPKLTEAMSVLTEAVQNLKTTTVALADTNTVLRDVISNNFNADNATASVYTATSKYEDGVLSWNNKVESSLSAEKVDNTFSVDGFNYSDNYVSDTHQGTKLIVIIDGLTLNKGASTDPNKRIYFNDKSSGIYKTGSPETNYGLFPRPFIDDVSNLVPKGTSGEPGEGVVVNKYLTANENGNYDLTMEAYATSMTEAVTTVEKVPTDFVLVVDQSGSMDTQDIPVGNPTVQNNVYLETIANGKNGQYYYKDGDQYYRVYGVKDYLYRYYPANYWFTGDIVEHLGADIGWFMSENNATTNIDNAFYFKEVVDEKNYYIPINTTIEGKIGTYYMRFKYPSKITGEEYVFNRELKTYSSNGNSPWYKNVVNGNVMSSGALRAAADAAVQLIYPNDYAYTFSELNLGLIHPRTGMFVNYPMYGRFLSYTKLCYRDVNGVEHEVPSNYNNQTTWEYCDDDGNARSAQAADSARPTYSGLYKFPRNIDRLTALKAALNEFALAVAQETDDFGKVDNKVSIVGFSSTSSSTTHDPDSHINYNYDNTELLTHTERNIASNSTNGWQKSTCDGDESEYYGKALVDSASEGQGEEAVVNPKITRAITALTHNGGTQPEDGLNMAYKVLANRSNTTYTIRSGDHKDEPIERNTVVIFFTDGQPGNYHESNQYSEANEVVQEAKRIKDYNDTSLFSIGVFGESDGNPLTYTANNDSVTGNDGNPVQIKNLPKKQWKYLGGWMESYPESNPQYCLRRQWRPGNANYTETANDTIYDYMSVTSSNYPDAENFIDPEWLNGTFPSDSYVHATDGVDGNTVRHKSSAEATNKYYRMASNQDTLVEAFLQAITMTNHQIESDGTLGASTILRDILKSGTFEMTSSTNYTIETDKGTADSNGVVTFDNNKTTVDLGVPPSLGSDRIEVSGFDYNTNSIFYGKAKDDANGLAEHEGRKLIVTLTNVVPKKTITSGSNDVLLNSNEAESGLWKNTLRAAFPTPAITRHSYTLNVDGDKKAATFDVTTSLVAVSAVSDDLSDVILVAPDGTRTPYNEIDDVTFTSMADGETFYFENVPPGYSVKTSLKAPDSFYTYTYWENSDDSNPVTLSMTEPTESTLDYSDNVLHVNSVSSYKTVTIAESVSGEYANTKDVFSVKVTLTPPEGELYNEDTIKIANDVTLNKELIGKSYKATIDNLPGDQNEKELRIPAGWTLQVEPVKHDKYSIESGYPKYNTNESATKEVLPSSGVEIRTDLTNIFINNIADDIPVTGINGSGHNWIIYILAAIAGIAVIGAGIFLWKKKDEFVEE